MNPITTPARRITPDQVHGVLARHMLADGYDLVLDMDKSRGRRLHDARTGRNWLDMFSFFGTLPLGINHPGLADREFQAKLLRAALVNPANSDVYTVEMAEFVETFARIAMPAHLPHVFFIAGGTLGVENALKAAFDWKVRRNFARGVKTERGHQVIHFRESFHGRSGYTLSLTNTADPRKYEYFPKFDWPRVSNPKLRFPVDDAERERVAAAERAALAEIERAFEQRGDDIACVLIEPIQAEGGDNHFRPEFLRALRDAAHAHEALLVFDEVQTGIGLTGRMWAHQWDDVRPDLMAFGKKAQVCGFMGGGKLDEEPDNVFRVSSRINSTWGGSLTDMVRIARILEIIESDRLVEHAATAGEHLRRGLQGLAGERPEVFSNARGRGLMCAVDLPDGAARDAAVERCFELGMLILPCGTRSIRFRPPLDVELGELDEGLGILKRAAEPARG
ncbi:MAG TPA: L-lysine 6-transaminase [Candidatus Eisenbacteria bacterium]|nr:L-lysine 6-transaminase [Candidatus Eisenbacteria bacterium]